MAGQLKKTYGIRETSAIEGRQCYYYYTAQVWIERVSNSLKTTKRLTFFIWTNLAFNFKALFAIDFVENIGRQRWDKIKTCVNCNICCCFEFLVGYGSNCHLEISKTSFFQVKNN